MGKNKRPVVLKHSERESLRRQVESEEQYQEQLEEARNLRPGQVGAMDSDRLGVDRELAERRKQHYQRVLRLTLVAIQPPLGRRTMNLSLTWL